MRYPLLCWHLTLSKLRSVSQAQGRRRLEVRWGNRLAFMGAKRTTRNHLRASPVTLQIVKPGDTNIVSVMCVANYTRLAIELFGG